MSDENKNLKSSNLNIENSLKEKLIHCLGKFILFLIIQIKKFYQKYFYSENKEWEYKTLLPVDDLDDNEALKVLEKAIERNGIHNIALTGPYGSGKSSIIKTFIRRNPELKCLNISLASFTNIYQNSINKTINNQDNGSSDKSAPADNNSANGNTENEKLHQGSGVISRQPKDSRQIQREIEIGIIKQLFYKVKESSIPQSRYRKLTKVSCWTLFFKSLGILILALYIFYAFFNDDYNTFIKNIYTSFANMAGINWIYNISPDIFVDIVFFIAAILGAKVLVGLYRTISRHFSINAIKIPAAGEVNIGKDDRKESIFDKNMDEIVYFFESTGYQIVFFEDLDRFDDTEIFVTLRALNNLLNNDEVIKSERRIIFVYALKDEMFVGEERTKFFDFIIPVIPVMSNANSYDELYKIFLEGLDSKEKPDDGTDKYGLKGVLTAEYIKDISAYIKDIRILYNICNEFKIYKNTLIVQQGLELDYQKLFSLITFKNLYPKYFAETEKGEGILKKIFASKINIVEELVNGNKTKISKYETLLKESQSEELNLVREVKLAMLDELADGKGTVYKIKTFRYISVEEVLYDNFDIKKELLHSFFDVYYIMYSYETQNDRTGRIYYKPDNEIIPQYLRRLKKIRLKRYETNERIKRTIHRNQQEILRANGFTLKTLFDKLGREKVVQYLPQDCQEIDMLIFFLRKGYIDENYAEYINHFKGVSLGESDMNFILSLKNERTLPFNYLLENPKEVINRLGISDFKQKEIYNYSLLEHLLDNNLEISDSTIVYENELDAFVSQLADEDDYSWKFIQFFLFKTKHTNYFIRLLSSQWLNIWNYISNVEDLPYEEKIKFLDLLISSNNDDVRKFNKNNCLSHFFATNGDILQHLTTIDDNRKIALILYLDIMFEKLDTEGLNPKLVNFIFNNCNYVLNKEMLTAMVIYKTKEKPDNLENSFLTHILDLKSENITIYIASNIKVYIENVYFAQKESCEADSTMHWLLKLNEKDLELCKKIIDHNKVKIKSLSVYFKEEEKEASKDIFDELLYHIMKQCKFEPSRENLDFIKNSIVVEAPALKLILKNADISFEDKQYFLTGLKNVPFDDEIGSMIVDQKLICTIDIFDNIWSRASGEKARLDLLVENIPLIMDKNEDKYKQADIIENYLGNIGGEYSKLANRNNEEPMTIPYDNQGMDLVGLLKAKNYIESYSVDKVDGEKKILVKTKKKE